MSTIEEYVLAIAAIILILIAGFWLAPAHAAEFHDVVVAASRSTTKLDTPAGQYRVLQRIVPNDKTKTHNADYFSVVGVPMGGKFVPLHVEIVSENWVLGADGIWDIDQWTFSVALDGIRFALGAHHNLREKENGEVLESVQPKQPSAEEAKEKLQALEAYWVSTTPEDDHYSDPLKARNAFDPHHPVTIIRFSPGGSIGSFIEQYTDIDLKHGRVVIDGECISACTLVLGLVKDVCATERGYFAFHSASEGEDGAFSLDGTRITWHIYPQKVRDWIRANGWADAPEKAHPHLLFVPATTFIPACDPHVN